jgi:aspartate aminotransferase-like enzyme
MSEKSGARRAGRLARQVRVFGRRHGGAEACVEYLGRRGARLVLVGQDGAWGDLVAPTVEMARAAAASAEVTVRDAFDGEMAARVRTGPYEWRRMAGIQIGGRANT